MAINVFISYSSEDISFKQELLKRLKPLSRSGTINVWHDGEIKVGDKWDNTVKSHLANADIVVLLISVDFIDCDYIFNEQLPIIINRRQANQLKLIPIIVRGVNLADSNIGIYQCLPQDDKRRLKPIIEWEENQLDKVWLQIDTKIRSVVKEVEANKASSNLPKPGEYQEFILNKHHVYTCDRVDQYDEFILQSKEKQKINYFYIFGQEYQSIKGFFNRIQYEKQGVLLDYLNPNATSYRKVVSFEITFEHTKNYEIYLENIYKSLLIKFFDGIDDKAPILQQTILDILTNSQKVNQLNGEDYICILLTISQEDWHKEITPNIIREVIGKFFDHTVPNNKPTILLFFGTTYDENDGHVEMEIRQAIQNGKYLKILPELEAVDNRFITKWFKKYNTFFNMKPKQLDAFRRQYFTDDIYDMDDIETELERLLDEYYKK